MTDSYDDGLVFEYTDPENGSTFAVHHEDDGWWVGFPFESGQLRIPTEDMYWLGQRLADEFGVEWGTR